MAAFSRSGDLQGAEFIDADLRGARFVRTDLSGVVMRAVDVQGADIDAPRLFHSEGFLRVNGVDVIPLIEAELNHRCAGMADLRRSALRPGVPGAGSFAAGWCSKADVWVQRVGVASCLCRGAVHDIAA